MSLCVQGMLSCRLERAGPKSLVLAAGPVTRQSVEGARSEGIRRVAASQAQSGIDRSCVRIWVVHKGWQEERPWESWRKGVLKSRLVG